MISIDAPGSGLILAMAVPLEGAGAWPQLVTFLLVIGIFYFIVLMPMRRRQKTVERFVANLKVGDRVVTTGGIYGSITKINERSVQLQVAEKVRIEVAKAAIGGHQGQEPVVADSASQ